MAVFSSLWKGKVGKLAEDTEFSYTNIENQAEPAFEARDPLFEIS